MATKDDDAWRHSSNPTVQEKLRQAAYWRKVITDNQFNPEYMSIVDQCEKEAREHYDKITEARSKGAIKGHHRAKRGWEL